MGRARGVVAALGLGTAIAVLPAPPAHACSCAGPDPATQIELDIVDSAVAPADDPWGGGPGASSTVDLRGEVVSVLGDTPALIEGLAIEDVPVLASVLDDPQMSDSCGTPHRPAVGSDLTLVGTVMDEGDGPFIYTGPCSGSLQVIAGPGLGEGSGVRSPPEPGRGVLGPVVIAGVAVVLLALVAGGVVWRTSRDDA